MEESQGMKTYLVAPDHSSITCLICKKTSHHPMDVQNLYCGSCHQFHSTWESLAVTLRGYMVNRDRAGYARCFDGMPVTSFQKGELALLVARSLPSPTHEWWREHGGLILTA